MLNMFFDGMNIITGKICLDALYAMPAGAWGEIIFAFSQEVSENGKNLAKVLRL